MSIENIIGALIKREGSRFWQFGDADRYDCEIARITASNNIQDGTLNKKPLGEGTTRYEADVHITDKQQGKSIRSRMHFLYVADTLIPLGTHCLKEKTQTDVYRVVDERCIKERIPLPEYLLENLPETVLLTRVVSAEEVEKWKKGDAVGMSTLNERPVVHTAIHSLTDEFSDPIQYGYAIKFIIRREALREAFQKGVVSAGTYEALFRGREADSPLSFETELLFHGEGIELLKKGYRHWANKEGVQAIQNPHSGACNAYI